MLVVAGRGDILMLRSRWRAAMSLYQQAIPVIAKVPILRDELASARANLARAQIELRQPAKALPVLEELAGALGDQPPQLRAAIELTLARALWDTGDDGARARTLASHAVVSGKQLTGTSGDDIAQIERWLAVHPGCRARPQ
jgi:hypothetical protein